MSAPPMVARISLALAEALWEMPSFAVQVAAGDVERVLYVPCPDGPWVQFTYGGLRSQDGAAFAGLSYGMDDLARTADGYAWSDVTIEFIPATEVPA